MFAIISARPVPIRPCGPSHIGQLRLPQMRNASRTRGARYVRGLRAWIAVMRSLRARSAAHAQTAEGWTARNARPWRPDVSTLRPFANQASGRMRAPSRERDNSGA